MPLIPRGVLLGILGGDVSPGSPNPDPISDQKMSFSTPVFRNRPLKFIPVFRPGLKLLKLERKQNSSNAFRIRKFLFRSYSFGIETITTFIRSLSSLENHTRFQTKMGDAYTFFQIKNHTLWSGTYLYGLHKGVPPSLPGRLIQVWRISVS